MNESFLAAAAEAAPGWMNRYFDVAQPWEVWWLGIGLAAQGVFFARWLIQWVASERRRESVMPIMFWWCSLLGATLLLIYFIGRREPVGVLGQLVGWIVYSRNLYLIRVRHRAPVVTEPAPGPEGGQSQLPRTTRNS